MTAELRITEKTTHDNVLGWPAPAPGQTVWFAAGAAMDAFAQLSTYLHLASLAEIGFSASFPDNLEQARQAAESLPGLLAVVRATTVQNRSGQDIGDELRSYLAETMRVNHRQLGMGRHASFVFHDPTHPVPKRLEGLPGTLQSRSEPFSRVLAGYSNQLQQKGELPGIRRPETAKMVLEAVLNAYEHGRMSSDGVPHCIPYGFTVTRSTFPTSKALIESWQVPELLSKHLSRPDIVKFTNPILTTFAIVDPGVGIPAKLGGDPWHALNSSLRDGVSSKPPGALNRGLGLGQILQALKELDGFMLVQSKSEIGYLSLDRNGPLPTEFVRHPRSGLAGRRVGTGLLLAFVTPSTSADQLSLFGTA